MIEVAATEDSRTDTLVDTEEELHKLLLDYAGRNARVRVYPKAVIEFAEHLLKSVTNDIDLDEIKSPSDGTPSLLLRTLGASGQEVRPYNPLLLELAIKIYDYPAGIVTLESANRMLIDVLGLNALFEQEQGGNMSGTLLSRDRFRREFGKDVHIRQVCTYAGIPHKH